jgi:hypothetical protein
MLTRTPYNAARRAERNLSPRMASMLPEGDDNFVAGGYIRVFQDVRGKHGSEGDYVMTRPIRGPLNNTAIDHATDACDTIDWLVRNIAQTNGKVGMVGSSYEGFTVLMALADPHPALKAAAPMSPMVDGWLGDDWFHNGAFRANNIEYFGGQTGARGAGAQLTTGVYDDYESMLRAGSVAGFAKQFGFDQLTFAKKVFEHPAYDSFWQEQALDRVLGSRPLKVPTMTVVGRWDQEDIYGASRLRRDRPRSAEHHEPPGGGPVAPQRRQLQRFEPGRAQVHRRHRRRIPARRDAAVLRPVPEGRRAEGRHAAGVLVPDRHQQMAAPGGGAWRRAPIYLKGGGWASTSRPRTRRSSTNTWPTRPSRCRSWRARCACTTPRCGSRGW